LFGLVKLKIVLKRYILFFIVFVNVSDISAQPQPDKKLALELAAQINAYRTTLGLPTIAISEKLTKVAEMHVIDLSLYPPSPDCNMHSWSANGSWKPCCYTRDHANAPCMWDKPKEITGYQSQGFEIAHRSTAGATPQSALVGWQKSPGHHEVIINKGQWSDVLWQAMGVGICGEYAVVWFGMLPDGNK
jgi:hypothetical protein